MIHQQLAEFHRQGFSFELKKIGMALTASNFFNLTESFYVSNAIIYARLIEIEIEIWTIATRRPN